jgi:hypothetical protein
MKETGQTDEQDEEQAAEEREKAELEQAIAESMALEVRIELVMVKYKKFYIIGSQICISIIKRS